MKFTKMHGAGNDFVILNNMDGSMDGYDFSTIAKKLCAHRTSIGADGMMVVVPAQGDADFRMVFYNADGSLGEMCGNGARCIVRYGYEMGLSGEVQKIETTAGIVTGRRIDKRLYRIRLNDPSIVDLDREAEVDGKTYLCGYMELGNPGLPHAIVILEDFDKMDERELFALGEKLRWHKAFPKGANVTFCYVTEENRVLARTFERGVEDFTLACGTGCGCTASVLALKGLVSGKNTSITMPGGELFVSLEKGGVGTYDLYLTGPTNIVAQGEVLDEDLKF